MSFPEGEPIEAYVDPERFSASVHASIECTGCHESLKSGAHPSGGEKYRSRRAFRLRSARICRRCHDDAELGERAVHLSLLERESEGQALICTDCHQAHGVKAVAGGNIFHSEQKYCMGCHEQNLSMEFRDRTRSLVKVDASVLGESAHRNLSCSDCHFGFSSDEHPRRNFQTRREYSVTLADVCRRCHFDKYTKTLNSIHYAVLSTGDLSAPVCTDCHGTHGVAYVAAEKAGSARKCKKCHSAVYKTYAASVHGAALFEESNRDVPVCTDCHRAHNIDDPLSAEFHEHIPTMCSNCHARQEVVGKYGLSTDVVKTYLTDFHGITLGFYKQQRREATGTTRPIAVCTDCHGTHNIATTVGPGAAALKANLLKRCMKCHPDASGDFPDTWLSHYVPSMKKAPMVFIVNSIYKTLLPMMLVGLVLQIALHIWRYISNR